MNKKHLDVVVGVISNSERQVLVAQRAAHVHAANCWEFPGGKLEENETEYEALCRELLEEIDIQVQQAIPLMQFQHEYPEHNVTLYVWHVATFIGKPHGKEGQPVRWITVDELDQYEFPQANQPLLQLVKNLFAV